MYEYFALKKYMKSKVGFTLVEIMIVIFVLGILVAIGAPLYFVNKSKTEKTVCLENQQIIFNVLDAAITNEVALEADTGYFHTTTSLGNAGMTLPATDKRYFQIAHYWYVDSTGKEVGEETLPTNNYFYLFNCGLIKDNDTNRPKMIKYLCDKFFNGKLPYCPFKPSKKSASSDGNKTRKFLTGDKKKYEYYVSVIYVYYEFDEDGDPYITQVKCATSGSKHGTSYKYK